MEVIQFKHYLRVKLNWSMYSLADISTEKHYGKSLSSKNIYSPRANVGLNGNFTDLLRDLEGLL